MTMDFTAPDRACPRHDLGFLLHRRRLDTPVPAVSPGLSLDTPDDVSARGVRTTPPRRRGRPGHPVVRVRPGERTVLSHKMPTATLNRLQSAIGLLTFGMGRTGPDLVCAYEFADGRSGLLGRGAVNAPANSRTPALSARHRSVSVDLRQLPLLTRLLVIAVFPATVRTGLLSATTWDGGRIERPVDQPPEAGITALLSMYNVDGELVLRAESAPLEPTPRAACAASGFARISWLDDFDCAAEPVTHAPMINANKNRTFP